MKETFVSEGRIAGLEALPPASFEQRDGYVECRGLGTVYAAKVGLGEGDFRVLASLRLRQLAHTAATFQLGPSHFGFDGAGNQLFTSRGWFGDRAVMLSPANTWLKDNEWFAFEAERRAGVLTIRLDGHEVLRKDVGDDAVGSFGLRPWRAVLDLRDFSVEGKLFPLSTQPAGHSLPVLDLALDTARQAVVDREPGQYLGHPNTVLLADGKTILCVYPKGHGRGAIVYKRSTDGGKTWSERLPVPENWETSKETPTIHRLTDRAGVERLLVFSGLYPIRRAVSEDQGRTWTPLEPIGAFGGIVAMGDVVRLRNGDYAAFFHDDGRFFRDANQRGSFTVYQTVSHDGGLTWAEPTEVASLPHADLCEPGAVRSPDGKTLALVLRENSRRFNSFVVTSEDEGRTWSEPRELSAALTGDRHQFAYAPDGRLVAVFRDTTRESVSKGDFVAWVGRYEDIAEGRSGHYRVRLLHNTRGLDCGYPGLEVLPDGTFVATTYGHWATGEEPYVVSVRFRLAALDRMLAETEPKHTPVFGDGLDGYPNHRIPSLVTTKQGTLLAICEGRGLQAGTHGDITGNHLVLKRSADNGESWGPLELIRKEEGNSLLGPCTVVTDTGRIVLVYHRYLPGTTEHNAVAGYDGPRVVGVFVITSDDDGKTWSDARDITRCAKRETGWTGILTGPGLGIQKRRAPHAGRIVIPCAHGPVGQWHCYTIHSDDNGETWELGGEVPDPLGNECQVVELADGRLMINTRSYRKKSCRAVILSEDGGATWSSMQDEPALLEPVCQGSILRYSDPLDGEPSRLLFSNPAHRSQRENGTVRLSLDEGKTWSRQSVLVPGYFGYSCLTRLSDGRVGCLYETAGCREIRFASFLLEWLGMRLQ
jgi:photosystem II stability/assembly factor-like uncharacterized protein